MLMYLLCRGVLPRLFVLLSTQALWSYVFIRQKERLEAYRLLLSLPYMGIILKIKAQIPVVCLRENEKEK